jgi:hypothetical protein
MQPQKNFPIFVNNILDLPDKRHLPNFHILQTIKEDWKIMKVVSVS